MRIITASFSITPLAGWLSPRGAVYDLLYILSFSPLGFLAVSMVLLASFLYDDSEQMQIPCCTCPRSLSLRLPYRGFFY